MPTQLKKITPWEECLRTVQLGVSAAQMCSVPYEPREPTQHRFLHKGPNRARNL